jgi:molybdopterin synthase sulfur carrier subunit
MKVNFYAMLRPIVGGKTVEAEFVEGLTVRQLVQDLVARFPGLYPELLDEDGNLHRHVHVFVNGRDVPFLADHFDTRLAPNDMVNIFPPVGGG